jgi:hypothetical protein
MTYQHVQEFMSLQGDPGQPLIGVIAEEQGHEVVRYFIPFDISCFTMVDL